MEDCHFEQINKILSFYNNNLSSGFKNNIFNEGSSEKMVLARLERASKDDASGNHLSSRYAIWAHDLSDLVDTAITSMRNNDTDDALRLLDLASNSIKAYKDIQTVFDGEFQKVTGIFEGYANHMLRINNSNSVILKKAEIIKLLKVRSGVAGANLPRDIDFTIKNRVLNVYLKDVAQDMQNDSVAFEGWILILKHWLSEEIDYVILDFDARDDLKDKFGFPDACHYNRFLYRAHNFSRLFPLWFFISENRKGILSWFMNSIKPGTFLLNHSLSERASVLATKRMERQVESWFVFHEGKDLLTKRWSIDGSKLFNQLPVGVFINEISGANAVFSRGASAIDMWGIDTDGTTLHLIELKCGDNKGLGVIGETLFYTSLLYDTCITNKPLFTMGKYGNTKDTSDAIALKNNGIKFDRIVSHILAEKYHPLFAKEVEDLIHNGLMSMNTGFDRATYDYSKKVIFDADNHL